MGTSSSKFEIIQNTLSKSDNRLSVSSLCEIAGVILSISVDTKNSKNSVS